MTWEDYEAYLELRIEDIHGRVHRGAYRPQPSRRVYIDKAGYIGVLSRAEGSAW